MTLTGVRIRFLKLLISSLYAGAKSLILVNNGMGGGNKETADTEEISYEFLLDKFHLPAVDTYYNCKLFTLPDFKEKHHAIEVS